MRWVCQCCCPDFVQVQIRKHKGFTGQLHIKDVLQISSFCTLLKVVELFPLEKKCKYGTILRLSG